MSSRRDKALLRKLDAALSNVKRAVPKELAEMLSFPRVLKRTLLPEHERASLETVETYAVTSMVTVSIEVDRATRTAYYIVEEQEPDEIGKRLFELVMTTLYAGGEEFRRLGVPPERLRMELEDKVVRVLRKYGLDELRAYAPIIAYYIVRQSTLGELYPLLLDRDIEEIELGLGGTRIIVLHARFRKYGALLTNIVLRSKMEGQALAQRIASFCSAELSTANPTLSVSMPEFGYRFTAVFGVGEEPPSFNIRKYPREPFTPPRLVRLGTISPLMVSYIWLVNEAKRFWLPAGASGTGKNTLLNALMMLVDPKRTKVVAVMDTMEFTLRPRPDLDPRLYSRFTVMLVKDQEEMLQRALHALRYVPDYLVINEVRGVEIKALERAVASGDGVATTIHAGDPKEVLSVLRAFTTRDEYERLILSLAAVVMMAKIGRSMERKAKEIHEFNYEIAKEEPTLIFEYRRGAGKNTVFEPSTVDEVIQRSTLLREKIPSILKVSRNFVRDELEIRSKFIERCVVEKVYGFEQFALMLLDFYEEYYNRLASEWGIPESELIEELEEEEEA